MNHTEGQREAGAWSALHICRGLSFQDSKNCRWECCEGSCPVVPHVWWTGTIPMQVWALGPEDQGHLEVTASFALLAPRVPAPSVVRSKESLAGHSTAHRQFSGHPFFYDTGWVRGSPRTHRQPPRHLISAACLGMKWRQTAELRRGKEEEHPQQHFLGTN